MLSATLKELIDSLSRPLTVIDLAGTGVNPKKDRIVYISLIHYALDYSVSTYQQYFRTNVDFNIREVLPFVDEAVDFNRQPTFKESSDTVFRYVHNAHFCGVNIDPQLGLLKQELQRCGHVLDTTNSLRVDPVRVWRSLEPRDYVAAMSRFIPDDDAPRNSQDVAPSVVKVMEAQLRSYNLPCDLTLLATLSSQMEDTYTEYVVQSYSRLAANFSEFKMRDIQFKFELAIQRSGSEQELLHNLKSMGIVALVSRGRLIFSAHGIKVAANDEALSMIPFACTKLPKPKGYPLKSSAA